MLRYNAKYISENRIKNFINDNDGAFAVEETRWGKHLFNYQGDHTDLVGLGYDNSFQWERLYRFCVDNIKFEDGDEDKVKSRNLDYA